MRVRLKRLNEAFSLPGRLAILAAEQIGLFEYTVHVARTGRDNVFIQHHEG